MILILFFLLGLAIGSFLNVLIDRFPREESVIKGRSHCDKCKENLKWYDLVPLLSFIFLKGKCRYCHTSLSLYYPTVEFITGIMFVITFLFTINNFQFSIFNFQSNLNFQFLISLIYYLFIVSSLVVVFFADLKYGIIPDKIVFPAIVVSTFYLLTMNYELLTINFFSAVGACLFFLTLFLITKGRGMGFGDVKFSFLTGLVLGFPNIIIALYVAFLTGAIVGCILILWRKKRIFGTSIPFGPFLVIGTLTAIFFGEILTQSFLRLVSL